MRVLIIEDHPMVIDGLVLQLKTIAPHARVDHAMNWPQAHRLLVQSHHDQALYHWVVLDVDLTQSGQAPLDLAARIQACQPGVVWVCSALDDPTLRNRCEQSGARWVPKAIHWQVWHRLVHEQVRQLMAVIDPVQTKVSESVPDLAQRLTPRQLDVLTLATSGMKNADIARRLSVSEETVRTHLRDVFRELGVRNRTQAGHVYWEWQKTKPLGSVNP